MEADLAKVRRWVKEADAGEEVLNQLPLSAADKVERFREVLSKIWEPQKEIPRCSDLDELMDTMNMKKRDQQEDIRISAGELQAMIKKSTRRAGGPDQWTPDHWNMLPRNYSNDWQRCGRCVWKNQSCRRFGNKSEWWASPKLMEARDHSVLWHGEWE